METHFLLPSMMCKSKLHFIIRASFPLLLNSKVVKGRNERKLRSKIMIGGAVTTPEYAKEIGAEGYSKDAQEAVMVAKKLVQSCVL